MAARPSGRSRATLPLEPIEPTRPRSAGRKSGTGRPSKGLAPPRIARVARTAARAYFGGKAPEAVHVGHRLRRPDRPRHVGSGPSFAPRGGSLAPAGRTPEFAATRSEAACGAPKTASRRSPRSAASQAPSSGRASGVPRVDDGRPTRAGACRARMRACPRRMAHETCSRRTAALRPSTRFLDTPRPTRMIAGTDGPRGAWAAQGPPSAPIMRHGIEGDPT